MSDDVKEAGEKSREYWGKRGFAMLCSMDKEEVYEVVTRMIWKKRLPSKQNPAYKQLEIVIWFWLTVTQSSFFQRNEMIDYDWAPRQS